MLQKIRRLAAALIIIALISSAAPARAFQFTDISRAGVQWQGTKENPVRVDGLADALCKYMRLRGITLGKMYYTKPDGGTIDQALLVDEIRLIYPFLMSVSSWYEYGDAPEYEKMYYIELFFFTPEYVDPAIKKAEEIVAGIVRPEMGYIEKIRVIHDYLVDNVEYDWDFYNSSLSDIKNASYTAYGALLHGRAVCEGYSSAFMLMCHAAGIPSYLVTGTNVSGPHSWNLVYLYGSFYHIDVTGDDTSGDRNKYFMLDEKGILKTHTVDTTKNRAAITSLHSTGLPSAQILCELGLMRGAGTGFDLDRSPSRLDAAVMLTRLTGREAEATSRQYAHPFTDVPDWASPYIGCMYRYKLTTGASQTLYDGARTATTSDYLTFMLRSLGYSDSDGAFTWDTAVAAAERIGLVPAGRYKPGAALTRGEMAVISVKALVTRCADGKYLLDSLIGAGVVDKTRAAAVSVYMPAR